MKKDLKTQVIVSAREYGIATVLFRHAVGERLGLSATDMECLGAIFFKGFATPSELAEYTGLSTGATTAMIDRLEKAALIERHPNPDDRRSTLIKIVPETAQKVGPLFASVRQAQDTLLANYSQHELKLLQDFFSKMTTMWEQERKKLPKALMTQYDAVIVLSGGISRAAEGFTPTTYADSDDFGMMGGHMRLLAAAVLHGQRAATAFVFTTGVTAKTTKMLGANAPSEASVYSQKFLDLITKNDAAPTIILEDRSTNTTGNVQEFLAIIRTNGWKRVAVLSSDYHLPRIKALCTLLDPAVLAQLAFLSAEDIVRQELPGKYDAEIDGAYSSKEGKKRLKNEAIGLKALKGGNYIPTEFQLHKQ